jgi:rRNA maturation RNase YbeY
MSVLFLDVPTEWMARAALWEAWLRLVAEAEGKTMGNFSFRFMTDEDLLVLNKSFLDHDTYTDVITFDRSRKGRVSADVAISWERILDNAAQFSRTGGDEVDRVLVHAVLHTCGYGDKSPAEELEMRRLEDHYLHLRPHELLHVEQC